METLTLGQMLDAALGSPSTDPIDFEQLRNLLNGMLLHLGLRDLPVQESGEPLEGAAESPFSASFLEELKQKVEANEKEIIEVKAVCQELREEVNEMKAEQSRLTEDLQKFQEALDPEMLDFLHNHLLEMMGHGEQEDIDPRYANLWDDPGLIVIGSEIILSERPKPGDSRPGSPLHPKGKVQGRGKDLLQSNASSRPSAFGANVMARRGMGRNVRWRDTGQDDMGQDDMGQDDMGQGTDEEIKAEALSSPLDAHPEATDAGQIKDGKIKQESQDGSFTTPGMHPGAPGTHRPDQQMQSVRGHPGSQNVWIPSESVAGTSSRLSTPKDARGGSPRLEPFPGEDGLRLLKMPSPEYSSCDPIPGVFGQHLEVSTTPPPSPGLSGRLPPALRKSQTQEQREQASDADFRGSPRYCGGKHTSSWPMQPMVPLLSSPEKPDAIDLVGSDGVVYRGRSPKD